MNAAKQPQPQPDPLDDMDALRTKITFANTSTDTFAPDQFPELGDQQTFLIEATCVGRGVELLKDGEKRKTVRWEVTSLKPQGRLTKPDDGPNLFSVDE